MGEKTMTQTIQQEGTFLGYILGYKHSDRLYNGRMGRKISQIEKLLRREINSSPRGTIVPKTIHGSAYYYLQWYENGTTKSRYLKDDELFALSAAFDKRDSFKQDLSGFKRGKSNHYLLMHQNVPVGEFEVEIKTGRFLHQIKLYHPDLLPIGVHVRHSFADLTELNDWFSYRVVPSSRDEIDHILSDLELPSPGGLSLLSRGLNLVDQYWIRRVDETVLYEDVNFFDRGFSDQVGDALLGKGIQGGDFHNPSSSTNGDLKKAWRVYDGERFLLKAGTAPTNQAVFNEAAASAILDRLHVPHAEYDVVFIDGIPYSRCPNFVDRDLDFVDARHLMKAFKKHNDLSYYQHFLYCCDQFGIADARGFLDRMLTIDFIIGNEDRHFGNFGALRDANTLQFLGMSPIYDNESCLAVFSNDKQIKPGRDVPSKPFKKTHREQLGLVESFDWLDTSALKEVPQILRDSYRIAVEKEFMTQNRVDAIVEETSARIDELLAYIKSRDA